MRQIPRGLSSRLAAIGVPAAALAACAASNAPSGATTSASAATPAPDHDWRELVVVPFGTLLKDVPYRLGEVVLFRDSAGSPGAREDRECYTLQGAPPPRWFGRQVDEYSVCFSKDRLNRVEASARLPAESATAEFAAACGDWQHESGPAAPVSDHCEVREGTTEIDARLGASEISAEPVVSIILIDRAPAPAAGP